MTFGLSCAYCGAKNATRRLPGQPPTCSLHRDLPAAEAALDAEVDERLAAYYDGEFGTSRVKPRPALDT